jgi:predicted transposase/invertase (TIGR01784 family)
MSKKQADLSRYLNLFTDFAFKWVFGRIQNKDILIDFLNTVLEGEQRIVDLEFQNSERLGMEHDDRKVAFDLLCQNDRGEQIIVELQQAPQTYFKDRALYYVSNLIQEQGIKGKWDYSLKPTYVVAILNFEIDSGTELVHRVRLHDQTTGQTWSNSIQMVFIEVNKFKKSHEECTTHFERWLFLFSHLHRLEQMPIEFQEQVFLHLFETAEIGRFPEVERLRYTSSLTEAEQLEEALKYAKMIAAQQGHAEGRAEGHAEGHAEGRAESLAEGENRILDIITAMLAKGSDWDYIKAITQVDQKAYEAMREKFQR